MKSTIHMSATSTGTPYAKSAVEEIGHFTRSRLITVSRYSGATSLSCASRSFNRYLSLAGIYSQKAVKTNPRQISAISTTFAGEGLLYNTPTTPRRTDSKTKKKFSRLSNLFCECRVITASPCLSCISCENVEALSYPCFVYPLFGSADTAKISFTEEKCV